MANNDAPFGCTPVGQNGGAYNGQVTRYYIPASDSSVMAVGDLVKSAGSADTDGVPSVNKCVATQIPRGIIVGFDWQDGAYENLPNYRPASVEAYVFVADDPQLRFVIQEDSVGGALAATDVGLNAPIATADANATTGRSQTELDSSGAATTATLEVKILELYQTDNNEIGTNARWVCSFNEHELSSSGTAGV